MKAHPEGGDPDTHGVIDVKHKVKLLMNLTFPFTLSYIANTNKYYIKIQNQNFLDNLSFLLTYKIDFKNTGSSSTL